MEVKVKMDLSEAVQSNNLSRVQDLLDQGCDPNGTDSTGKFKLIHVASAKINGIEVLDALVNNGADINATTMNNDKLTPLGVSIRQTRLEHLEYLLEKGVDVNGIAKAPALKPIHLAIGERSVVVCRLLLENGANPNIRDSENEDGYVPLHYVTVKLGGRHNYEPVKEITKLLLEFKADPMIPDPNKMTPLHRAAINHNSVAIKVLLKDGSVDLAAKDKLGRTPLFAACDMTKDDKSPYSLETRKQMVKCVKALCKASIAKGVDIDAESQQSSSPLAMAVRTFQLHQSLEVIKVLLSYGADPNKKGEMKQNLTSDPLSLALTSVYSSVPKSRELTKLLVEGGADPNRTVDGTTVLLRIVRGGDGYLSTVKFLIEEVGADPNQLAHVSYSEELEKSPQGSYLRFKMTALQLAVLQRDCQLVHYLIESPKVDLMKKDEREMTPKDLALEIGNSRAYKWIKEEEKKRKKKRVLI